MKINISKTLRMSFLSIYARVLMIARASVSKPSPKSDKDLTNTRKTIRTKRRKGIRIQIIRIICSARSYHNSLTKMEKVLVTRATAYQLCRWSRIVDSHATHHPSVNLLSVNRATVMRRKNRMACRRTIYAIDLSQL